MKKNTWTPKIESTEYIEAGGLFAGLTELFDALCASEPDFTWGGNNHSMVTGECILNHFDNSVLEDTPEKQLKTLRKPIKMLPQGEQAYIDLEN